MDQNQTKLKTSAKDFFLNLGSIIALGTVIVNFITLLFTVIEKAYPPVNGYEYSLNALSYSSFSSSSISWPVSSLIIFFPLYILLMWLLEREYKVEPEKRGLGLRKWLAYGTLFIAGLCIAWDLVTVIYYFIDGQEMTTGFMLKALSILVVALAVFFYYISDVLGKINSVSRKIWVAVSSVIVIGGIIWGFSVIGLPHTQQLIRYDEQKVGDLQNLNYQVQDYWNINNKLPLVLEDIMSCKVVSNIVTNPPIRQSCSDGQTMKRYEYKKTGNNTYSLCAEFNKESQVGVRGGYSYPDYNNTSWAHPAGYFCFPQVVASPLKVPPTAIPINQ
ncbi:MAG: DUF5671 domain-containing protein [bacterium]